MITMSNVTSRFSAVALAPTTPPGLPAELEARIAALYALAQRSDHVFASPLGPFHHATRPYHVPHFAYFGPHTSDESPRIAFYAGERHGELHGALALLHFVRQLARTPEIGHGLNLSFFPLVDVLGTHTGDPTRHLADEHWALSCQPELSLLEKDIRLREYHAFVRVVATTDELVGVRLRSRFALGAWGGELLTSADVEPWPVRFEAEELPVAPVTGPLTAGDDLACLPFELTLALPAAWTQPESDAATASILHRFVDCYRAARGYAQNL